ncbi:hypothetical protein, partial [Acinetobacter sp. AL9]|uniref:hypothetical protein n=1 Tax=Acinetobacter sp. AL9 TaxID=3273234 RepID=UPI003556D043
MKKSFQLSAVAIAIAASSSVMADVIDTAVTPSFDTDALMSVTATTVNAGQLFVAGQDVGSTLAQNTTDISINTNTINQEITDRQIGDALITAGIATNVTTAQLNATDATVTGTLTASAVNIVNANSLGVPNTSTSTSGISTTQKYNAGTIAGIADDVYKITEQDPSTGTLTDKYYTKSSVVDPVTGKYTYTKVELDASQKAALPFTGNKTGQTLNDTKIEDVIASQSTINGQKVDFSNSKTRDTTVDIKGDLLQIDPVTGNRIPGQDEVANGQALSNQVKLEENRAAIGILDRDGNPQTQDEYYGVNTVKTIYDEPTKTRTSGDTTIEGDSIVLTSTTTVDGTLTGTKTTSVNASGITTSRINGNGANGALVLHGGTNSTTQTLDDNGVKFVTTDASGTVTGTTTIAADGTLTVQGVNVTGEIAANTAAIAQEVTDRIQGDADTLAAANTHTDNIATVLRGEAAAETVRVNGELQAASDDRAAIRTEFAAADTTLQNNIDAEAATREAADNAATTDRAAIRTEFAAADTTLQNNIDAEAATREAADNAATTDR